MSTETVIILCGGKGLRLRPLTNDLPKPLVEIDNKPILEHIINHFRRYNYTKFVIATGYMSDKIEQFMLKKFDDLDYEIIDSGDVEIIKRLIDCTENITNNSIVCYGDTLTDININNLKDFHERSSNSITVSGYQIKIPFGVMRYDMNNYITSFEEKPILESVMNIGFFYISKTLYSIFKEYNSFEDMLIHLTKTKKLKCYVHQGIHITVNTVSELQNANENIKKLYL